MKRLHLKFDQASNPRRLVHHTHEINADIPCDRPEAHQRFHAEGHGCVVCKDAWYSSLPWQRKFHEQNLVDDSSALFSFLRLRAKLHNYPRYSRTKKDVWVEKYGQEWKGYTLEEFGIDIGETKDFQNIPFRRPSHIHLKSKPDRFIPILRYRICYEPQIESYPLFLEIIVTDFVFRRYEVAIKGLEIKSVIKPKDLSPLLKARDFFFTIGRYSAAVSKSNPPRSKFSRPQKEKYLPKYEASYQSIITALEGKKWKVLKKYEKKERQAIIREAYPTAGDEVINALSEFESAADVAYQHAAWTCTEMPIGTWGKSRLVKLLKESKELAINKKKAHERATGR